MKPDTFREPVTILVGLGFPAEAKRNGCLSSSLRMASEVQR